MSPDVECQRPVLPADSGAPAAAAVGGESPAGRDATAGGARGSSARRQGSRLSAALTTLERAYDFLPAALTAALALRAGGFFPTETAVFAIGMALLLLGRVTLADRPLAGWSPALAVTSGALALFAGWTLLSALWSDAPLRAMLEFDRALAYALLVAVMGRSQRGRATSTACCAGSHL